MKQATITTERARFEVDADTVRFEAGWLHYTINGKRVTVPSTQVIDVRIPVSA